MMTINLLLEKYIFEELGGIYSPAYLDASLNLENDEEKNKRYLGTYFPRTFVEAYYIYNNIFLNEQIIQVFKDKKEINILIIGSGTGGDLIGLLQVLNNYFIGKKINVYSFDGNKIALRYQRTMIKDLNKFMNNCNNISVTTYETQFTELKDIKTLLERNSIPKDFDIVQTFKFCNELYNQCTDKNVFKEIVGIAEEYLLENGVLVLEDITNKNSDGKFNSVELTNQVREYFKENSKSVLGYIIPKCCGKWHKICNCNSCFTKLEYNVSHRWADEISKITYKLIVKNPLGEHLSKYLGDEDCYIISNNTYCTNDNYLYNQPYPPKLPVGEPFIL